MELGIQAASDKTGYRERGFINKEGQQWNSEADHLAMKSNVDIQYEKISADYSRIADPDIITKVSSEIASANIRQNASVSGRAQANQTLSLTLRLVQ
jgi:flagellin-like hook-associated protein FlgL